jgi:hypothetical protein
MTRQAKFRTTSSQHSGFDYKNPYHAICAAMVNSMVLDLTGDKRRLFYGQSEKRGKKYLEHQRGSIRQMVVLAQADLRDFKSWPLFQKAMNSGMDLPNDEQIKRILNMSRGDLHAKVTGVKISVADFNKGYLKKD